MAQHGYKEEKKKKSQWVPVRCSNSQLSLAIAAGAHKLQHCTNTPHPPQLSVCPGCIQSIPLHRDSSSTLHQQCYIAVQLPKLWMQLALDHCSATAIKNMVPSKQEGLYFYYSICSKGMAFLSLVLKAFMLLSNTAPPANVCCIEKTVNSLGF